MSTDNELPADLSSLLNSGGGGGQGGGGDPAKIQQQQEEKQEQQNEMRNQILSQVLDQPARARLNTLTLAKPQKGQQIEQLLINMARMGQLRGKIGETELIGLLERVSEGGGVSSSNSARGSSGVHFDRRRANLDSDDDDEDFLKDL